MGGNTWKLKNTKEKALKLFEDRLEAGLGAGVLGEALTACDKLLRSESADQEEIDTMVRALEEVILENQIAKKSTWTPSANNTSSSSSSAARKPAASSGSSSSASFKASPSVKMTAFDANKHKVEHDPNYCRKCKKRCYPAEKVIVDEKVFHKMCLRCQECKKKLAPGNAVCLDDDITYYCDVHAERKRLQRGGGPQLKGKWAKQSSKPASTSSSSTSSSAAPTPTPVVRKTHTTHKSGGDKPKKEYDQDYCAKCGKRCYPAEKVTVDGKAFHKLCLRCKQCNKKLTPGDAVPGTEDDVTYYCTVHAEQQRLSHGGGPKLTGKWAHHDEHPAAASSSSSSSQPSEVSPEEKMALRTKRRKAKQCIHCGTGLPADKKRCGNCNAKVCSEKCLGEHECM